MDRGLTEADGRAETPDPAVEHAPPARDATASLTRAEREALALRENLRRRKEQARARRDRPDSE